MFVIDASVWVARYVAEDTHHFRSSRWIFEVISRRVPIFVPAIVLPEVAGPIARRTGNIQFGQAAASQIATLREVSLISMDIDFAQRSAELAASLKLRGADATYVAVAVMRNAVLVTLDDELRTRAAKVVSSEEPWYVHEP